MRLPLTLALASLAAAALPWSDTGHMVVAEIARRKMSPKAIAAAEALVKVGATPRTDTFLTAACWADDTRTPENGPWHYINLHFRTDGKPTAMQPEEENAVVAVERFTAILADRNRSSAERADALRYVLHFVGDLHQPLHAVARDTDAHPTGDRGGNEFKLQTSQNSEARNLHALWDGGAGLFPRTLRPATFATSIIVSALADRLMAEFPEAKLPGDRLDAMGWAEEGLALAKKTVYALPENSVPTPAYLDAAQRLSGERAALAGYRLARILNRTLG